MPIITTNFTSEDKKITQNNKKINKTDDYNNIENISNRKNKTSKIIFQLTDPMYSLEDMILPKEIKDKINDVICSRKYNNTIFEKWGLGEVLPEFKNKIAVNLYGEPAKNLESAFKEAKEKQAILFFDEADALLSRRVTNMNNSTDVSVNQTRSVLLMLMNTYDDIILFTTNFINNFDEAFMRRIQFHIKFEMPNAEARSMLWNKYIPDKMPNDVNIEEIANKYGNVSGSDISNAVLAAAFKAARSGQGIVKNEFFEEAIESIIKSKNDNKKRASANINDVKIEQRYVNEEYVKKQVNENGGI